jgi:hypothetical protein
MPAAIWAAPMARVRLGRLERPCMRSRQGLGPRFQALASATGWIRAMTPSPMRTMAAKCFARVGVVMSMMSWRWFCGQSLSVQRGRKKQIPEGNDRKKGKCRRRMQIRGYA